MDPLTAALTLATKIIELYMANLELLPPEQKAQYAQMVIDDMKAWRDFLKLFKVTP